MVKPTHTSELIKDIRLPPDKGKTNKKESRPSTRRSLRDDSVWATPPSSPLRNNTSGHIGAGEDVNKGDSSAKSKNDTENVIVTKTQRTISGINSNPNFRQRTESQKRKPSTEGNNNSKSARIEEPACGLRPPPHST